METGLAGRRVWITGASGGIGQALARGFAKEGCALWLSAGSRGGALADWARANEMPGGTDALDVRSAEACEETVARAVAALGGLDICVVNAGIWPAEDEPLHETDPERLRRVLDINLLGALHTARAFLQQVRPGQGVHLCFIGSTAGRFGEPNHVAYAASKAAMRGIVRSLCVEVSRLDCDGRVNLVEPGWTLTEMAESYLDVPGVLERALVTTPLQRIAQPEDIAEAVVWLSSRGARHVSGEFLTVSGGMDGRVRGPVDADAVRRRARSEKTQ